jgi:NAD(P)-dependent dehydrogenase (short-subunit alcohol dehydrogenase family)
MTASLALALPFAFCTLPFDLFLALALRLPFDIVLSVEWIFAMAITPQVALVTGASRGIGRGIAIELARLGFSIAINYLESADVESPAHPRRQEAALECKRLCVQAAPAGADSTFELFQADVSKSQDRAAMLKAIQERFGWIDLLVNNAGVAPTARVDMLEADEESFDRLMSINARGPYFLTQAVANFWIEGLKQRPEKSGKPKIVNISSVSAYAPSVNRGDYCMSKAALSMMTQLFAARLAEYGIKVYEIRPGIVLTDMTGPVKEKYDRMISGGLTPLARWGTPEDVGRAVAAIAEDRLPFSTGEIINVDGGFHIRRL